MSIYNNFSQDFDLDQINKLIVIFYKVNGRKPTKLFLGRTEWEKAKYLTHSGNTLNTDGHTLLKNLFKGIQIVESQEEKLTWVL